jgi:hypothetical protein
VHDSFPINCLHILNGLFITKDTWEHEHNFEASIIRALPFIERGQKELNKKLVEMYKLDCVTCHTRAILHLINNSDYLIYAPGQVSPNFKNIKISPCSRFPVWLAGYLHEYVKVLRVYN